jgi:hypothetical protein
MSDYRPKENCYHKFVLTHGHKYLGYYTCSICGKRTGLSCLQSKRSFDLDWCYGKKDTVDPEFLLTEKEIAVIEVIRRS